MLKNYEEAKKFLEELDGSNTFDIKIDDDGHKVYFGGLERVKELLKRMGNPDLNYKIIHVVGTAGKGTVSAYVKYFLEKQGFKVGVFSSPSLTTEIEKIALNDLLISPEEFYKTLNLLIPEIKKMKKHFKNSDFSAFEILTVLSLVYFSNQKAEYVILEAGLGGKYDSTNAISKSEISVLTTVGLDHTDILGDLKSITSDKSSVIEKSKLLITYPQQDEVLREVNKTVKQYNGVLKMVSVDLIEDVTKIVGLNNPKSLLINFALSIYCLEQLGFQIEFNRDDFYGINLPARFEIVKTNPEIILDGAHNPIKMATLVELLKSKGYRNLICIFSCFEDKDHFEILKCLKDVCSTFIFTSILDKKRKSLDLDYFKNEALKYTNADRIYLEEYNLKAYALARKLAKDNETILVTGSFKHVGKIREMWWPEERILEERRII